MIGDWRLGRFFQTFEKWIFEFNEDQSLGSGISAT
jgi:hypothetical protein